MSQSAPTTYLMEQEIVELIPALRAFSYRFAPSSNDADDLVQEAISRALSHLSDFKPGTCMKSWLFTIMRNAYYTTYRRGIRESCGRLDDAATYELPVSAGQDWAMRATDVNVALLRLSVAERTALLLVAEGTSYRDAADTCGCKIGTIKSRVSRARLHLAEILGEAHPTSAAFIN